jgi:hypothetical protein
MQRQRQANMAGDATQARTQAQAQAQQPALQPALQPAPQVQPVAGPSPHPEESQEIPANIIEDLRQLNQLYQCAPSTPPPATQYAAPPQVQPRLDLFSLPPARSHAAPPQLHQQPPAHSPRPLATSQTADPQLPPAEQTTNSQEQQPLFKRLLVMQKVKERQRAKSNVAGPVEAVGESSVRGQVR